MTWNAVATNLSSPIIRVRRCGSDLAVIEREGVGIDDGIGLDIVRDQPARGGSEELRGVGATKLQQLSEIHMVDHEVSHLDLPDRRLHNSEFSRDHPTQ